MTSVCSHPKCSFDWRPSYRDIADTMNGLHRWELFRSRTLFMSPEVEILMCRERDKENRRNTNRKNSNQQGQQELISPIAPARRFHRKDQGLNNDSDNNTKIGASKKRGGKGTIQNTANRLKAVFLGSRRFGGSTSGSGAGGKGEQHASSLGSSRCLTGSTALMVMGDAKMASELLAEAPLASAEEDFSDFNLNKLPAKTNGGTQQSTGGTAGQNNIWTTASNGPPAMSATAADVPTGGAHNCTNNLTHSGVVDDVCLDFGESNLGAFSASLEDLVSSFDERITKCLRDYDETTEQLAPVQVRSKEEIMKTDQVWWTLTGNYGNIMPIDWSKSYARKMQLDALNINEQYNDCQTLRHSTDSSDEEDVDRDLDLHSLILSSLTSEPPAPVQSADEVIRQIEDIMAESCSSDDGIASGETTPVNTPGDRDSHSPAQACIQPSAACGETSLRAQIAGLIRSDRLRSLSIAELVEVYSALEREVQSLSETLVAELAQRDELDFEKETKNTFISLLLTVQNKRRQFTIDRKRGRGHTIVNGEPKFFAPRNRIRLTVLADMGAMGNQSSAALFTG
ncbi:uncharacterized protein LOC111268967 isoform X2 [Varroa jacobsoni]|uniref:uncharacterized protein LOC111268967 isoform X2 n=1 Tax=Varroa jacobsoni TaxID=62625 RepID=UPI000BF49F92|nr:uncharacterized protein LOC111268967 isoform X2 [Varroa jacobsoni]